MKNKLRELRKAKHLIQKDIAQATGMSVGAYQQYETDKRDISLENLLKLAEFFDVTSDEILLHPIPERYIEVSADEKKMIVGYRKLDRQHQRLIHVIIRELLPPEVMPIQQTTLRMAGRDAGNPSDLPVPPENPEKLQDVSEIM